MLEKTGRWFEIITDGARPDGNIADKLMPLEDQGVARQLWNKSGSPGAGGFINAWREQVEIRRALLRLTIKHGSKNTQATEAEIMEGVNDQFGPI